MREVDVLILIEHVDRELDAVTCLAERLRVERGLTVEVRNFYADMLFCLNKIKPRVIVTPFFYFLDHHPMKDYVDAWGNVPVVNLAWEQILYKMNRSVKIPQDTYALNRVVHFCWTEKYRQFLTELGVSPERLVVSGNPVMQFYSPPYSNYFKSRDVLADQYNLDKNRRWVLFPENYRWAFLTPGQVRAFVKQGADLEEIEVAKEYCQRSLAFFFRSLKHLNREDDPVLIFRPRPATSKGQLVEFAQKVAPELPENVRIIKAESAREWILASDHVLSSYSTTLIEAALAGKPINVFSPEPFPDALEDEWYHLVSTVSTTEELMAALRGERCASSPDHLRQWATATLTPKGDPFSIMSESIASICLDNAGKTLGGRQVPALEVSAWAKLTEVTRKVLQKQEIYHHWLRKSDRRYAFTLTKHERDVFGADDAFVRRSRWSKVLMAESDVDGDVGGRLRL